LYSSGPGSSADYRRGFDDIRFLIIESGFLDVLIWCPPATRNETCLAVLQFQITPGKT